MCEYFADDKDGESLQQDWVKAEPSDKEAKQGWLAGWLVGDQWGSAVMRIVLPCFTKVLAGCDARKYRVLRSRVAFEDRV